MSTLARQNAQKLRIKFAKAFGVPLAEVEVLDSWYDEEFVGCRSRPDLPVWSTGDLSGCVGDVKVKLVSKQKRR